jgi:predicted DNA-binding antitoxin AbrB/MazE fold protein
MSQILTAIFVDGVFKPSEPVQLPERSKVILTVELLDPTDVTSGKMAKLAALEELWRTSTLHSTEPHLTRDQLHERR